MVWWTWLAKLPANAWSNATIAPNPRAFAGGTATTRVWRKSWDGSRPFRWKRACKLLTSGSKASLGKLVVSLSSTLLTAPTKEARATVLGVGVHAVDLPRAVERIGSV